MLEKDRGGVGFAWNSSRCGFISIPNFPLIWKELEAAAKEAPQISNSIQTFVAALKVLPRCFGLLIYNSLISSSSQKKAGLEISRQALGAEESPASTTHLPQGSWTSPEGAGDKYPQNPLNLQKFHFFLITSKPQNLSHFCNHLLQFPHWDLVLPSLFESEVLIKTENTEH